MTWTELLTEAMTDAGITAPGETAATSETDSARFELDHILGTLSAQGLPIYQSTRETFALTGAESYTPAVRPLKVRAAAILISGVPRIPLDIVTPDNPMGWTDARRSNVLYHDGGFPTSTYWIRPAASTGTLEVFVLRALETVSNWTASISLPPGYEQVLQKRLAFNLCHKFGRPLPEGLAEAAAEALGAIGGLNQAVLGSPAPEATE